jgi:hypothetical protein
MGSKEQKSGTQMSKSQEYELVTRAIFQLLVDQDEARNIAVQHNVEIPGKFLKHQVDVYWELETGGIKHRTVIECKDWNRPLEQEKLMAFRSKLEDLNSPVGVNTGGSDCPFGTAGRNSEVELHWNRTQDHWEQFHRTNRQYRGFYMARSHPSDY